MTDTLSTRARAFLAAHFPAEQDQLTFDGQRQIPSQDTRAVLRELTDHDILEARAEADGSTGYRLTSLGLSLDREPGRTAEEALDFILRHGQFPVFA
ncbi:MAG: hypothetical protein GYB53_15590 [Rhodobacteraceae bacterium]|nr:hypothetical protein [Paracoccaceae bacterium]MBR9822678.1 hypothetical protein [Paracoccaceae bacterium]